MANTDNPHATTVTAAVLVLWCLASAAVVTVARWHSWTGAVTWAASTLFAAAVAAAIVAFLKARR